MCCGAVYSETCDGQCGYVPDRPQTCKSVGLGGIWALCGLWVSALFCDCVSECEETGLQFCPVYSTFFGTGRVSGDIKGAVEPGPRTQ